jgi:4-hydroxy-tetrahydrodipicolinate synthase
LVSKPVVTAPWRLPGGISDSTSGDHPAPFCLLAEQFVIFTEKVAKVHAAGVDPLRGMMPILPTVVTPAGALDERSQRRLIDYCLDCGAVAIGHFGIASEFHKISEAHRRRLTEWIVDQVGGRVPVFIGVTAPGVAISVDYARQAEQLGADMLMASLPYVNLPDSQGTVDFYAALAESVTLPIIVQDTPQCSAILTVELIERMGRQITALRYVKAEGLGFVEKTARLLAISDRRPIPIGGACGRHMIHLLRLGVTAFMTGTEALDLHAAVVGSFLEGDEERAASIYYERVLPYLEFYMDHSEELLKWMLHDRGVIGHADVLAPPAAPPMGPAERIEFEWVLDRIGWRNPARDAGGFPSHNDAV